MVFVLPSCKTLKMTPIVKAADQGQINEMNRLLAQGVLPDAATKEGVTPLFMASLKGHEDIVKRLIDKGADVNAAILETAGYEDQTLYKGRTPLMAALNKKHTDIAKILIKNGADVNAADVNGTTPLFIAAALNDGNSVRYLIENGADVNAPILAEYQYKGTPVYKGATPLMAALKMRQNKNAALLVENGADVNARTENGISALMIAAASGDCLMQEFLLAKGADPQVKVTSDCVLIEGQSAFEGANALIAAAEAGDAESVAAMIKTGADVNSVTKTGITALMAAASKGHLEAARLLVANDADVNARTTETFTIGATPVPKGTTALMEAAHGGFPGVVEFLIESGAEVNAKDDDTHIDALFLAAEMGHMDVVKILIENGADVYAETKMGTALGAARHYGHPYIAQYILDARKEVKLDSEEE